MQRMQQHNAVAFFVQNKKKSSDMRAFCVVAENSPAFPSNPDDVI